MPNDLKTNEQSKPDSCKRRRTTVRFSEDEFSRIKNDSTVSGESIPQILKNYFFKTEKLKVLFPENERHQVCKELRAIGNNINQIARRVNNGALEGWHAEITEIAKQISEMYHMIASVYGLR